MARAALSPSDQVYGYACISTVEAELEALVDEVTAAFNGTAVAMINRYKPGHLRSSRQRYQEAPRKSLFTAGR